MTATARAFGYATLEHGWARRGPCRPPDGYPASRLARTTVPTADLRRATATCSTSSLVGLPVSLLLHPRSLPPAHVTSSPAILRLRRVKGSVSLCDSASVGSYFV
ncbi:hypothetical protein NL676_014352 [Syzygium grande]|nr:hypothetical protein NL676_014352 [Syzygium grande]